MFCWNNVHTQHVWCARLWEWNGVICEWHMSLSELRESLRIIFKSQKANHRYDIGVLLSS